jgi:hypothetical protein
MKIKISFEIDVNLEKEQLLVDYAASLGIKPPPSCSAYNIDDAYQNAMLVVAGNSKAIGRKAMIIALFNQAGEDVFRRASEWKESQTEIKPGMFENSFKEHYINNPLPKSIESSS